LETGSDIVAPAAYSEQYVYVATSNGEVFSMHELTGQRRWKYATGFPVTRTPAVVGNKVFVTSDEPMLHCVDAEKGTELWEVPHISQFAAASANRVYGVDDLGALVVMDSTTGATLGRIPTDGSTDALVNDQTDRVYLVSSEGVVQCLREIGSKQPMYHRPKVEPEAPAAPAGEDQPTAPAAAAEAREPAESEDEEPGTEETEEEPAEIDAMEEEPPAGETGEPDAGLEEDPFGGLE
jgi:hypothetical protein